MNNYTLQTLLFEPSNTCVCHVKQYCLAGETILFRPSSTNVSVTERCSLLTITLVVLCLLLVWTDGRLFRMCDFARKMCVPAFHSFYPTFDRRTDGRRFVRSCGTVNFANRLKRQKNPPTPVPAAKRAFVERFVWQSDKLTICQTVRSSPGSPLNGLLILKKMRWNFLYIRK